MPRRLPDLRVGLHLTLVDGHPLLPPAAIPALVDSSGAFPTNLTAAGVRWFFLPAARRDLRKEIRAQFEAFRATGLKLDHVNAHNHMHLHPTVLGMILDLAREFAVPGIRLPYEPPSFALAPWIALMRARLRGAGLRYNDTLLGLSATGHFNTAAVLAGLDTLGPGVTEFYFHPAVGSTAALESAAPGYDRGGELAALISPEVAARLGALNLQPVGFSDL